LAYVFDPINNTLIDDEDKSLGNKFAVLDSDLEKVLRELNERFGPGTIQEGTEGIPTPPKTIEREMFKNAFKDSLADGGRIGFDNGTQIRGDKGLYLPISDPNNPQRPKWLKYKELVEEANNNFKFIDARKNANLREQAGLPRRADKRIDSRWKAELDIPELDSLATKVKKYVQFMQSDLNAPASKFFDFRKNMAKVLGVDQAQLGRILKDIPEYQEIVPVINKLGIPASKVRLLKNNNTIGDVFNMVENRPIPTDYRNISQSPEKFILESVDRHIKQGGKKIAYTKKPGTLDATGKLITDTDAEFIYKGKKYSFDDLSTKGRKLKVFDEIYKMFDLRDQLFNTEVIDPRTNKKIKFIDLAKDAYNVGAGYSYVKPPYEIDHGKSVVKEPFKFIRIIPRRINQAAGIVDEKILQKTFLTPKKKKIYTKKNVEQIKKTIGYNFDKTIDQLKNDELKLFKQILVPSDRYPDGRKLRSPIKIGMESIGTYLNSKKQILTNKINSGIPIDDILSTIANDLKIPVEQVKNVAGKTLKVLGKATVAAEPVFAALDAGEAFREGLSGKQATNYVVRRFIDGVANLPALAKGGFDFAVDKARGKDAKFEMPYEVTLGKDYKDRVLEQTPEEVLEARKAQLEFDQTVRPNLSMVDDIDMPASKAEIEAARNKFMDEKGVDLSVLDNLEEDKTELSPIIKSLVTPDETLQDFMAHGGRAGFSNGGAAGADDNFLKELEFYFTNEDAELPKLQTYKETMNPVEVLNDIIDPRNYPYYADVLARSGLRIGEFAVRVLPATGKLVADAIQKGPFKITGSNKNNYVQDYTDVVPSNIEGTGIFSEFLKNITPTATEKFVGLDKLIEKEEEKQIERGSTAGPKVFADTVGLGAEVTAPIFPGLKLLNSFAKARNLPNDKATQKILEEEVDKVLSDRGMSRREFLQMTGASATVVMAKMLGLMDVAPKATKVVRAAPIMDDSVEGMPAWFKEAVYVIERKGLLKSRGDIKGIEPDFFEITLNTKLGPKRVLMSKNDRTGEITLDWTTDYYDTELPVTITYKPGLSGKQNFLSDPEIPRSVEKYDVEVEAPEFEYKTVDVESMGPEDTSFDSAINLNIKEEADAVVEALEDLGLGLTKKQKKDAAENFRYYNDIELDEGTGPGTQNPIDESDAYTFIDMIKRNRDK